MCTINNTRGKLFGCEGCQVPIGKGICGETRTLDIVNEFRRLYEEKMQEIDTNGGGDCLQEKFRLQQEWIGDLTEQNEMLVRAVEELEHEATERVKLLEEKLQQSAQCICEVEKRIMDKEGTIQQLQAKIDYVNTFGDVDVLNKELKARTEECETLKQAMVDMRQALTEEVASKHDTILQMKRDCLELEDKCIQADKQTAFKDDIIKELRKEIKHLRQQVSLPEKPFPNSQNENLIQTDSSGEPYLVVNHTRKIVHSGKSTIIYLRHHSDDKKNDSAHKSYQGSSSMCIDSESKCSAVEHANAGTSTMQTIKDKKQLFCKSENDLCKMKEDIYTNIKHRSKLTSSLLNRYNTFIDNSTSASKSENMKNRNVNVPNHIPVKMYVNNIEFNKKQF